MNVFPQKWHKIILSILVLIIVLVGSAVLALPSLVNSKWFKKTIDNKLTMTLGRGIRFNGIITLKLSLSPSLTIHDFVMENPDSFNHNPALTVGELKITVPLLQNYWSNLKISEIQSKDIKILVAKSAEGKSNWEFPENKTTVDGQSTQTVRLPKIKKISFENILLSVKPNDFKNFKTFF